MSDLILAEQLLLLFLDDEKGSDRAGWSGDPGLAGALLLDLTSRGALEEEDGQLIGAAGRPEHPLLAAAQAAIAASEKRRDAKGWVSRLPKDLKPLRDRTAGALVERGVLGEERRKLLGLFPSTRYPQSDPEPERALRERLRAVLLGDRPPAPEEAMLVALLLPYDLVKRLVPKDRRKEATRRAKQVAAGGAAAKAVDDAIASIQAAVIASTTAAVAATTATAGNS